MLVCRRDVPILRAQNDDNHISDRVMEKAWRHAKKTLISVGGKGATIKHGNSLRQLLEDHTIVKVKVNTKSFGMYKAESAHSCCFNIFKEGLRTFSHTPPKILNPSFVVDQQ